MTAYAWAPPLHGDSPIEVVTPAGYADTTRHAINFKIEVNDKGKMKVKMKDLREKAVLFDKDNQTLPLTIDTRYGRFILAPTKFYNPAEPEITLYVNVNNYDSAAEDLSAEVQTGVAQKNTKVISITYETENPEFGKKLINTIISRYNEQGLEHKNRRSEQTIRFLDDRINLLLGQIRENDETTLRIQGAQRPGRRLRRGRIQHDPQRHRGQRAFPGRDPVGNHEDGT